MRALKEGGRSVYSRVSNTLVWYWTIIRRDGFVYRFVAHDQYSSREALPFFSPEPGVAVFATRHEQGLVEGSTQLLGICENGNSLIAGIRWVDVHAGRLAGAVAIQQLAPWEYAWFGEPIVHHVYDVGEIEFDEIEWTMQLTGLAGRTKQKRGAIYTRGCLNQLGLNDGVRSFCQAVITNYPRTVSAVAVDATLAPTRRTFSLFKSSSGALLSTTHVTNIFAFGYVRWLTGQNAGLLETIETSTPISTNVQGIILQNPLPFDVGVGDTCDIVVGCDKQAETCFTKFNQFNQSFRGAPDIPGFDLVFRSPSGV